MCLGFCLVVTGKHCTCTILTPDTLLVNGINGINGVVKTGKIYLILMILSDSESDYESDGESDSMSDTSEAAVDNDGL